MADQQKFDKKGNVKVIFHYNDKTQEYKAVSLKKLPPQDGKEFGGFLMSVTEGKTGAPGAKVTMGLNLSELSYFANVLNEMVRQGVQERIEKGE